MTGSLTTFKRQLPNAISLARAFGILPLAALLIFGQALAALVLLTLLIASDWLDGYLARRFQVISRTGTWLDPLADKVMVLGLYVFFACWCSLPGSVLTAWFWLPIAIITLREVYMIVLRSRAADAGKAVPASKLAKIKTTSQFIALYLMVPGFMVLQQQQMAGEPGSGASSVSFAAWLARWAQHGLYEGILLALLWLAAGLTLLSVWGYIKQALHAGRG